MRHDVLSDLALDGDAGNRIAMIQYELRQVKIRIIPDDQALQTTLQLAVDVVGRLNELDLISNLKADRDHRDTYNDDWNEYDEAQADGTLTSISNPVLSEAEFEKKLSLNAVNVTGNAMISFFYDDDNMFWGHTVVVTSLRGLNFANARAELFG